MKEIVHMFMTSVLLWTVSNAQEDTDDWHLVFRAVAGVSSPDPYDLWISHTGLNEDKPEATELTDDFKGHYKSSAVMYWNYLDINEVKVSLYKDGSPVKELVFDARNTNNPSPDALSWFDVSKLKTSPWTDLTSSTSGLDLFSAKGDLQPSKAVRRFVIQKVSDHQCEEIEGWLAMVTSTGPDVCPWSWDSPTGVTPPFFVFSTGNTVAHWESEISLIGKTATQISTWSDGNVPAVASRGVDGNTEQAHNPNFVCAITSNDAAAWWMVDLGASTCISKLIFYNRNDGTVSQSRIVTAEFRVGDNNDRTNPECTGGAPITQEIFEASESSIFDITCNLNGRYITINFPSKSEFLQVCELRAFACPSGPNSELTKQLEFADVFAISIKLDPASDPPLRLTCASNPCEVDESAGFIDVYITVVLGSPIMEDDGRATAILSSAVLKTKKGDSDTADAIADHGSVFTETTVDITVPIEIVDDELVEGDETFSLELIPLSVSGPITDPVTLSVTIKDNDAAMFEFDTHTYITRESDTNHEVLVTIVRQGDKNKQSIVQITTIEESANEEIDYTELTDAAVVFQPGDERKEHPITIVGDDVLEGTECFQVALTNAGSGGVLGKQTLAKVIIEDDDEATKYNLNKFMFPVQESAGQVSVTVQRNGDRSKFGRVVLYTSDVDATSPYDYTSSIFDIDFQPGAKKQTRIIPITNNDVVESSETFEVTLRDAENGELVTPSTATVMVKDDDVSYSMGRDRYETSETEGTVRVAIIRQGYLGAMTSVNIRTKDVTAFGFPETDFESVSTVVMFPVDESIRYIDIGIHNDGMTEDTEEFLVELLASDTSVIAEPASATVTIKDEVTSKLIAGSITLQEMNGAPAVYGPELGNPNSEAYRELEQKVLTLLNPVLAQLQGYLYAEIVAFLPGSVIVQFVVAIVPTSPVTYENVVGVIASNTDSNGFLGGSSFKVYLPADTTEDRSLSDAALTGIIIAFGVLFIIVVILIFCTISTWSHLRSLKQAYEPKLPGDYHANPPIIYDGANLQAPFSFQNGLGY